MKASHRWLLVACLAILVAGAVGIAVHHGPARLASHRSTPSTRPPARTSTTTHGPRTTRTTTAPTGPAGPDSTTLAANMITPTDMGGFYQVQLTTAASILNSAPCLAGLEPAPVQSGRAATGLVGPDYMGVPTIVEVAASYPGTAARAVYRSLAGVLQACPTFPVDLGGTQVRVAITRGSIPAVGDAETVYAGQFVRSGQTERLQLGLVLDGQTVLALLFIDSVPPSNPLFGDFPSTLSNALGKLA